MTKSLILIILAAVVILLIILFLTGHKSVHDEVVIQASPEKVWQVLTDIDAYSEWNPAIKIKEGKLNEGEKILFLFIQGPDNQYDIQAKVKAMQENKLLNQVGGTWGVLTFDHKYILEPEGAGTRLTIHEEYKGVGVNFWDPSPLEEVYAGVNKALKARVESM